MRRKFIAMIAAILIANIFVITAAAETGGLKGNEFIISPMYTYISNAEALLSINSSGNATAEVYVTGNSKVTSIKATIFLQQYKNGSWTTIKIWNESSDTKILNFIDIYNISRGYEYRVRSTVTAYSGQESESTTVTSSSQYY
ncbi:hypothetical protein [Sedimentibacter sp.]|uniref:hypothetical protein n=1 Tax=Sedimentibacter sp. TaxID=1960295 RepID=UPI0028A75258|nr:hypothetical protein [Sedimentibacter sp.]